MDAEDLQRLVTLNNDFYRENAASFSRTRKRPWPGWERIASLVKPTGGELDILDVACGNLRFECFLEEALPGRKLSFACLDACAGLAMPRQGVAFSQVDVIEQLRSGRRLMEGERRFDMAVTFGFMHHVPTQELRRGLLEQMIRLTKPGGRVACSFWRFADEEDLARKARQTTEEARGSFEVNLGAGDYLLGWDGKQGAYRYCHSFSDDEIDALAKSVARQADLLDRFTADGRTKRLNEYLVLERRA